tara:strand:+ start:1308 stop:2399 length:1092 start_codon:yes stop_codon:yes gene_type:complete
MKSKIILFMPCIDTGGVEKNFFLISNFLAKNINNVTVITISKNIKKQLNRRINVVSLNYDIWNKLSRRIKFVLGLFLLIKEIFKNKDAIVLSFQANIYCGFLSKLLGFNLIIRSNSSPEGWSKNFIKKQLYKFGLNAASQIIVNSLEFKKIIKKKFNINSVNIYNPLNSKEIIDLSKKKIKFNFFEKNYLNLINIGRLENQKDHLTLLRAIKLIKDRIKIKLLIIGNGSMQNEIGAFIEKNNLKSNVKIINNLDNPFPYLLKSDLFVLSSIFEGLPNVLLEALTLNKFVISTNCSTGPAEILVNGKGGILVPIKNYKKLARSIIYYNSNKQKLKKKLHYAKKHLKRFDFKKNLNSYLNIINKI